MRNNVQKAFTLVELIVVITILAILGTIAFLSLQWYSADARNSKRSSDTSNIQGAIVTAQTKGSNIMSFITANTSNQFTGALTSIGWTGTIVGTDYTAWSPNYVALWLKAADFKDPGGQNYVIGVTTKANWKFEIASSTEQGVSRIAAVSWNYIPRTNALSSNVTSTYTAGTFSWVSQVTLADADINKFFIGDTVSNSGSIKKIINISSDLKTLTFDSAMGSSTSTKLYLGSGASQTGFDEQSWLTATGGTVIINGSTTNLPY